MKFSDKLAGIEVSCWTDGTGTGTRKGTGTTDGRTDGQTNVEVKIVI